MDVSLGLGVPLPSRSSACHVRGHVHARLKMDATHSSRGTSPRNHAPRLLSPNLQAAIELLASPSAEVGDLRCQSCIVDFAW